MCDTPMTGPPPSRRAPPPSASWPRELHRAALFLGIGGVLYWLSFATEGTVFWIPNVGVFFPDLFLAWLAVLTSCAAWPSLWAGLKALKRQRPEDGNPVIAWRAFLLTLLLILAAVVILPLRYSMPGDTLAWLLVLYVSAWPFLAWTFVPILALHGIVFGRVANYLDAWGRRLAKTGAALMFAVAAVTTIVILQNPDPMVFMRAWSAGQGLLPAASCLGYVLIATAMTIGEPAPEPMPTRGWALARTPRYRLSSEHAVYHR